MFLCACPPGRPSAGEPSTGGPLRQPAGPREGPSGGRRSRQAGAVVHVNGFPVQGEGKKELGSHNRGELIFSEESALAALLDSYC